MDLSAPVLATRPVEDWGKLLGDTATVRRSSIGSSMPTSSSVNREAGELRIDGMRRPASDAEYREVSNSITGSKHKTEADHDPIYYDRLDLDHRYRPG